MEKTVASGLFKKNVHEYYHDGDNGEVSQIIDEELHDGGLFKKTVQEYYHDGDDGEVSQISDEDLHPSYFQGAGDDGHVNEDDGKEVEFEGFEPSQWGDYVKMATDVYDCVTKPWTSERWERHVCKAHNKDDVFALYGPRDAGGNCKEDCVCVIAFSGTSNAKNIENDLDPEKQKFCEKMMWHGFVKETKKITSNGCQQTNLVKSWWNITAPRTK